MGGRPIPLSSDYIFEFQSTDFESDSKLALRVFSDLAQRCLPNEDDKVRLTMFGIAPPRSLAGWHFSKLYLSSRFVRALHKVNLHEFDKINPDQKPKVKGKVYVGDPFATVLAVWINDKLKGKGCRGESKNRN